MGRTQEERRAETHALLLNAAAELFAQQGFHATSAEAVATAADRTTGALYNHFGGKEGLLVALLERWIDQTIVDIAASLEGETDLDGRLGTLWDGVIRRDSESGDAWLLLEFELWLHAVRDPELSLVGAQRFEVMRTGLAGGLTDWSVEFGFELPAPPEELAAQVIALVNRLCRGGPGKRGAHFKLRFGQQRAGVGQAGRMVLHELHILQWQASACSHAAAIAGAGMGRGRREVGAAITAGGQDHHLGLEAVQGAVVELPRGHAAADAVVHDQVEGEVLDEELGVVGQRLAVHRVQHGVTGAVGRGAGALDRRFAEILGHAAEGALVDLACRGRQRQQAACAHALRSAPPAVGGPSGSGTHLAWSIARGRPHCTASLPHQAFPGPGPRGSLRACRGRHLATAGQRLMPMAGFGWARPGRTP